MSAYARSSARPAGAPRSWSSRALAAGALLAGILSGAGGTVPAAAEETAAVAVGGAVTPPAGAPAQAGPAGPAAARDTLADLFETGVKAYDAQDWDGALAAWEKLLRFRVASAAVEYDLGNAYFKKKEYGRAILHWERALRLEPGDDETRANLKLARGLLVDDVPAVPDALAVVLERARDFASLDQMTVAALALWQLLGLTLLILIAGVGSAALRRVAAVAAVLSALLLVVVAPLVLLEVRAAEDHGRAVVLEAAVEARSGPGEQYTTVFTVHEGLVVRVTGDTLSGWDKVVLPNGLSGWIPSDAVDAI